MEARPFTFFLFTTPPRGCLNAGATLGRADGSPPGRAGWLSLLPSGRKAARPHGRPTAWIKRPMVARSRRPPGRADGGRHVRHNCVICVSYLCHMRVIFVSYACHICVIIVSFMNKSLISRSEVHLTAERPKRARLYFYVIYIT